MSKLRIMIADDHQEIREYFRGFLNAQEDMECVAAACSGLEAVQLSAGLSPDVILMDIQMETRTAGIDAAKQILSAQPGTKVIILTILEDDDLLFQAYCAGVIDYIIKTDAREHILESIRHAAGNQLILRPSVAEKLIDELRRVRQEEKNLQFSLTMLTRLSNSEYEVLKCLYSGMNAREISESRFVSVGTVKTQIHSILQKFGMRSMKDVIRKLDEVEFGKL